MEYCKGIIPALLTPFDEHEDLDVNRLRAHVRRMLAAGVHGIFCLGTNGEFYALTEAEKCTVVAAVVEEAGGRVPVYAGSGEIATKNVIRLTNQFMKLGADAVSIITPYFINPTQEELYRHYQRIAAETGAPIILYNIPMRTHNRLEPDTVGKLAAIGNIIGIKDSSGDMAVTRGYLAHAGPRFQVMGGNDGLILDTLLAGGSGAIAATANVIPEILVSLFSAFEAGRLDEARRWQEAIRPLRADFRLGTAPGVIKTQAKLRGIDCGGNRMPVIIDQESVLSELKQTVDRHFGKAAD